MSSLGKFFEVVISLITWLIFMFCRLEPIVCRKGSLLLNSSDILASEELTRPLHD